MNILVANISGNLGKTMISTQLLGPRIKGSKYVLVETINAVEGEKPTIKGNQFGDLQEELMLADNAIVDVGSSNIEVFLGLMDQYRGSHEDYDYFVIPTAPRPKMQENTISTIERFRGMGVPAEKILVVFNMLQLGDDVKGVFGGIFHYHADHQSFTLRERAVIHDNEIYARIKERNSPLITDILSDKTDYASAMRKAKDRTEKMRIASLIADRRLAASVVDEHNTVFAALFNSASAKAAA